MLLKWHMGAIPAICRHQENDKSSLSTFHALYVVTGVPGLAPTTDSTACACNIRQTETLAIQTVASTSMKAKTPIIVGVGLFSIYVNRVNLKMTNF